MFFSFGKTSVDFCVESGAVELLVFEESRHIRPQLHARIRSRLDATSPMRDEAAIMKGLLFFFMRERFRTMMPQVTRNTGRTAMPMEAAMLRLV